MIHATFALHEGAPLHDRVHLVERRASGFRAWYDELMKGDSRVIGARPEGLVLKKRGTPLRAKNADGKVDFWIRCKERNSVDYVVLGADGYAEKGTPKIALGLYKNTKDGRRLVKVMSISWIKPKDWPASVPSGEHGPTPATVVEVEGAEVFPSGAVRHGHIKRPRPDKPAEDCDIESAHSAR
jgi:ATP-dependent DNA ligase